jgi:hypothetical protein
VANDFIGREPKHDWRVRRGLMVVCLLAACAIDAQQPAPSGADLRAFAAKRFPQSVRVGDLIHRRVLQPLESRPILGHVDAVIRDSTGEVAIVVKYGGFLGFGGRLISVPADAIVLLGNELEILDFSPQQLDAFPTFHGIAARAVADNEEIRLGLAHPSH